MDADLNKQMHEDHRNWRSEDNLWRDEIRAWQHEVSDAIGNIGELASRLKAHLESMHHHAASIRLYEDAPARHEHAIAEFERGKSPAGVTGMAIAHGDEADRHQLECAEHARLKERQHAIMSHWNALMHLLQRQPA